MEKMFKDMFYFGLGSANLARDVAKDFVDEMIRAGEAAQGEREKLLEQFTERAKEHQAAVEKAIRAKIEEVAKGLSLAAQSDLNDLREEIAALKKEVQELKEEAKPATKKKKES